MDLLDILRLNIFSLVVMAFFLGVISVLVKSDLKIPDQVYSIISIYLLLAVGLESGFELARSPVTNLSAALLIAIVLGAAIPVWSYFLVRRFGGQSHANAIAIAIHYGAVSAVTLSAAITFLNEANLSFEGFIPTLAVIMEIPTIILGLLLANLYLGERRQSPGQVVKAAFTSKGFLLLGGGVVIGLTSGDTGYQQAKPFFIDLLPGFLALFLLEMGTLVGRQLPLLRRMGVFLLGFGLVMPLVHGLLAIVLSSLVGLSVGGAMLMGTMAASASYITAPAVVEANVPDADVTIALTASLVITFPFNLTIGLPLYYQFALLLNG